jgi:hypothetical protein
MVKFRVVLAAFRLDLNELVELDILSLRGVRALWGAQKTGQAELSFVHVVKWRLFIRQEFHEY